MIMKAWYDQREYKLSPPDLIIRPDKLEPTIVYSEEQSRVRENTTPFPWNVFNHVQESSQASPSYGWRSDPSMIEKISQLCIIFWFRTGCLPAGPSYNVEIATGQVRNLWRSETMFHNLHDSERQFQTWRSLRTIKRRYRISVLRVGEKIDPSRLWLLSICGAVFSVKQKFNQKIWLYIW